MAAQKTAEKKLGAFMCDWVLTAKTMETEEQKEECARELLKVVRRTRHITRMLRRIPWLGGTCAFSELAPTRGRCTYYNEITNGGFTQCRCKLFVRGDTEDEVHDFEKAMPDWLQGVFRKVGLVVCDRCKNPVCHNCVSVCYECAEHLGEKVMETYCDRCQPSFEKNFLHASYMSSFEKTSYTRLLCPVPQLSKATYGTE